MDRERPFFGMQNLFLLCLAALSVVGICTPTMGQVSANRFCYLDSYWDPYYPSQRFPKLVTSQWVGEPGVQAVVTLGIDDMRDTAQYEAYLRPLLDALKEIDQRAAVSIMACQVDPTDPQLQAWLREGVSIETHTIAHPCPCLQAGDFAKAKATYDDCVDMMFAIPGNKPVAFRFPCMDSKNTPSPRAFAEILGKVTPQKNFLQASTSVVCVLNRDDPQLPKSLVKTKAGEDRFERYIPFPSFVNKIHNYPYPYVIGKSIWEFPCTIPDDWQGQNIQQPNNPRTVDDIVAAIDATVIKQGISNIVFHPYDWIRNDQMATVVKRVHKNHGSKVKFLTFRDCIERINRHMLLGQPVRASGGGDNGVRLLDLNHDGFLDVMIGNENLRVARIWDPQQSKWVDHKHDIQFTKAGPQGRVDLGVRIGAENDDVLFYVNNRRTQAIHRFSKGAFEKSAIPEPLAGMRSAINGQDQGVRLRDLDRDGSCEILVANPQTQKVFTKQNGKWVSTGKLPCEIVDQQGRDNGVRFVDLDADEYEDWIVANPSQQAVYLFDIDQGNFSREVTDPPDIPLIVRNGTNNGAWFAEDYMWVQNEDTHRMPDGVDRRSFIDLVGKTGPAARRPEDSLNSIQVSDGLTVELVACEPLVADPIAIDWGPDGKLWVVEMADYPLGIDDKETPGGRIRYLEDTTGDGRYDKSTVFLSGIAFPTGVIAWGDGVIVSAAPTVFFAADRDGDGKAEYREELYEGFVEGNQQHLVNGFERVLDNWLYLANGDSGGKVKSIKTGELIDINGRDLRIRPQDGSLQAQSGRTQFGRHRDDHGNWFGCSNPIPVRHYVLDDAYLARNPHVAPPSARIDIANSGNSQLFPISRVLSHWSGYKPPAPGASHRFTSACSTSVYRDKLLGEQFYGNTFTCEPVHNAVHRRELVADGANFISRRPASDAGAEFLASTDSWFRPATVTTGPDGAIWVVDMYRLVIEHPEWIDDQREKELFLRAGHTKGRIYRVFQAGNKPRKVPRLDQMQTQQLVELLQHENGRLRDMAQALIIDRGDESVVAELQQYIRENKNPLARVHALCTLDGLQGVSADDLIVALKDSSPTVRRHAIRLCEPFIRKAGAAAEKLTTAMKACDFSDAHVQMQLAYSLGESDTASAAKLLANVAVKSKGNPHLRAAIISSLHAKNLAQFHLSITHDAETQSTFSPAILQTASRMGDTKLVAQIVQIQLLQFDLSSATVGSLDRITRLIKSAITPTAELNPSLAKQLVELRTACLSKAQSSSETDELRAAYIRCAGSIGGNDDALTELLNRALPPAIQITVAEVIAKRQPDAVLAKLDALTPVVRNKVIGELVSANAGSLKLLNAIQSKKVPANAIGSSERKLLLNHPNDKVRILANQIFTSNPVTDRSDVVARYAKSSAVSGDPMVGQAVFKKNCSACHQVKGVGNAVGPNLTALKNRSSQAMLTAILDPNAAVEDKYRSYSVLTEDGDTIMGMIASESSASMTLVGTDGKQRSVLRSDIEIIRATGKSLMPEELEKQVTPEDMNHLLAYLKGIGPLPRTFDGNKPTIVQPTDKGRIDLTAKTCRIYGEQIVYESKFQNIGYWSNPNDYLEWTFSPTREGTYSVELEYACPDGSQGNAFEFTCGTNKLTGKVTNTGTWSNYRKVELGTITISNSKQIVTFRSGPTIRKHLMDLKSITLVPRL